MSRQKNGGNYITMNCNPFFIDQVYLKKFKKKETGLAGHAWRKCESLIRKVIEKNSVER